MVKRGFFAKPKGGMPTRHLFIANFGPEVGITEKECQDCLLQLGAAAFNFSDRGSAIAYASFESVEAAVEAMAYLKSDECQQRFERRFVVKHADYVSEKETEEAIQEVHITTEGIGIPGLSLYPNFVSLEKEQELLKTVDKGTWEHLANRRVQHYGYRFGYKERNVDHAEEVPAIPTTLHSVLETMHSLQDIPQIDQLTVNEYPPGVGLAPHIDTHSAFTGAIASLSLAGGCVMELRKEGVHRALYLPPRSLLVMAGPARYEWQHYIPHRKNDLINGVLIPRSKRRVSFTFRQARGFPCDCVFPDYCDSQKGSLPPTRLQQLENGQKQEPPPEVTVLTKRCSDSGASQDVLRAESEGMASDPRMEKDHVHAVYEVIAAHFSDTRFAVWPKVKEFLLSIAEGGVLADIGCGNGKYFGVRPDVIVLGSDRSFGLAAQAAQRCRSDSRYQRKYSVESPPLRQSGPHQASIFYTDNTDTGVESSHKLAGQESARGDGEGRGREDPNGAPTVPSLETVAAVQNPFKTASPRTGVSSQLPGLRAYNADVLVADALKLPYKDASADAAMSIAVLHHMSSVSRRVALLLEMVRLLKPGGRGLVTVWASEQENTKKMSSWEPLNSPDAHNSTEEKGDNAGKGDYFVPWHIPFHRADAASVIRQASQEDASGNVGGAIDRQKSSVVFQRYYHLFDRGELDSLINKIPGVEVVDSFYDKSNWCCVFEKLV